MKLNADLSQRAVVNSNNVDWVASPAPVVWRKPLERDGDEVARLTSIVRYDAGCSFPEHEHGGGEEFFVLEGTFEDEFGVYPKGTYVKNPVGTKHSPRSNNGCILWVKLRHMHPDDQQSVVINTVEGPWENTLFPGVQICRLDRFLTTDTFLLKWSPGATYAFHRHSGGEEIFVLEGTLQDELGVYPAGTWTRNPDGSFHKPFSPDGCLILAKIGHLPT